MKYLSATFVASTAALYLFMAESLQVQVSGQQGSAGRTTLVVSQNPNGNGFSVVDKSNNNQVINTNSEQQVDGNDEDDRMEEQVVSGLLEWLEEKKRKKREKKKKKKKGEKEEEEKKPLVEPKLEKKEIHIHINTHIKKEEHKKKKHHHEHKKHGGYEDYHDGHYDHDSHDKHYQGKHSWPLLGHHYNWDYDYHSGHGDHYGGHHGDDYGHESNKVSKFVIEKKPVVIHRPVLVVKKKKPEKALR